MKLKFAFLAVLGFTAAAFVATLSTPQIAAAAMPGPHIRKMYCASDDMFRHFCPADTFGGVELIRQKSDASCIYGRTWGFGRDGIWVDRGCRADFALGYGEYIPEPGYPVTGRTFYCASDDMGPHSCPVDAFGGVRLVRQRSEAACIYGQTWGYDRGGIWVDRGCRADFEIGVPRRFDRDDRPY